MPSRIVQAFAKLAATASAASLLLGSLPSARGCGLDWVLPRNHFEGVTNQGYVSYWEKIGEVDCGDGLVLPLHINFNSHRDGGAPSPYLGAGWLLPLLESKFVQEGEDRFNMIQPDGLNNLFLRAQPGGSVLNGSSGWKAELAGETIKAWASCGWKLVFANGRIASMTTAKGRQLDWAYQGGKISELREGGTTRLKVEYGPDGRVQALGLPSGERIVVTQDQKPRVQTVAGQNVVAGVDSSLSHLVLADGREQGFTFGTDDKLRPTLEIGNVSSGADQEAAATATSVAKRQVVWDPQSKLAVRDGFWDYKIKPANVTSNNAAIERTGTNGKKEYWLKDDYSGREIVLGLDGIEKLTTRFVSGAMAGKVKSIETTNRNLSEIKKFKYDESGHIIRELYGSHVKSRYYTDGHLAKIAVDNNPPTYITYNLTRHVNEIIARNQGDVVWSRSFDRDSNTTALTALYKASVGTNKLARSVKTFSNGKIVSEKAPDGKLTYFDDNRRAIECDLKDRKMTYHYSTDGQITCVYQNGLLLRKLVGDPHAGKPVKVSFTCDGGIDQIFDENGSLIEKSDSRYAIIERMPTPGTEPKL